MPGNIETGQYSVISRPHLIETVRAGEWWGYKLAPIFAAFYATAFLLDVPVYSLWRGGVLMLLSLVPGAVYVSVVNDLTDREEDAAAGKRNRLIGKPPLLIALLMILSIGAGIAFCVAWREQTLLLTVYLSAWLAYSLYSLPPFRLKERGLAGVLADASGAHLFPTLVAVAIAFRTAHQAANARWLIAVGCWTLANGVRGILWHQIGDVENDRRAGVRTFVARHSGAAAARLGTWIVFPLEVMALAAILWQLKSPWPVAALIPFAATTAVRARIRGVWPVVVTPQRGSGILLHEYYELFLPLSILVASAIHHPLDAAVAVLHLVVFPSRVLPFVNAGARAARAVVQPR